MTALLREICISLFRLLVVAEIKDLKLCFIIPCSFPQFRFVQKEKGKRFCSCKVEHITVFMESEFGCKMCQAFILLVSVQSELILNKPRFIFVHDVLFPLEFNKCDSSVIYQYELHATLRLFEAHSVYFCQPGLRRRRHMKLISYVTCNKVVLGGQLCQCRASNLCFRNCLYVHHETFIWRVLYSHAIGLSLQIVLFFFIAIESKHNSHHISTL